MTDDAAHEETLHGDRLVCTCGDFNCASLDLRAAFRQVFGEPPAWRFPRDASDQDEDTLQRSFGGLSKSARIAQRRPVSERIDELGYDRLGQWHADRDGAA